MQTFYFILTCNSSLKENLKNDNNFEILSWNIFVILMYILKKIVRKVCENNEKGSRESEAWQISKLRWKSEWAQERGNSATFSRVLAINVFWFGFLLRTSNRCGGGISFVVDVRRFFFTLLLLTLYFFIAYGFALAVLVLVRLQTTCFLKKKIGRVREMRRKVGYSEGGKFGAILHLMLKQLWWSVLVCVESGDLEFECDVLMLYKLFTLNLKRINTYKIFIKAKNS